MAPREVTLPGTRPTEKGRYCGRENSSATRAMLPYRPRARGSRGAYLLLLPFGDAALAEKKWPPSLAVWSSGSTKEGVAGKV